MPPRLLLLTILPILAFAPALSQAAGQPAPLVDQEMGAQLRQAGALARQAADELLRSFELLQRAIPHYGAPYLDQHGDIVVPRRRPMVPPTPGAAPTST